MAEQRITAKVHLYFRPRDAAVVTSLCNEGIVEKVLIGYVAVNPGVTEMEVYIERDALGIGWDIRVRGIEQGAAIS